MTRLTDRHGTKIPSSARGPWRSLWVARSGPAASTYKAYGKELHLLATVLTDDTELAQELVVQAIMTYGLGPSSLQELSSGVYVAWIGWEAPLCQVSRRGGRRGRRCCTRYTVFRPTSVPRSVFAGTAVIRTGGPLMSSGLLLSSSRDSCRMH